MSQPADEAAYAHLLGLYLGDGCLAAYPRTVALLLSLDLAYPGVIAEARLTVERTVPGIRVAVMRRPGSHCVVVKSYWTGWPELFPQHGPGRKHERSIQLSTWQAAIVERYPRELIRGLIHSDGCRTINRFSTPLPSGRIGRYEYPRYFFSNLSEDILTVFTDACDRLGVHWTRSNHRNISIARRGSVAVLDDFVGSKT